MISDPICRTELFAEPVTEKQLEFEAGEERTIEVEFEAPVGPCGVGAREFGVRWGVLARATVSGGLVGRNVVELAPFSLAPTSEANDSFVPYSLELDDPLAADGSKALWLVAIFCWAVGIGVGYGVWAMAPHVWSNFASSLWHGELAMLFHWTTLVLLLIVAMIGLIMWFPVPRLIQNRILEAVSLEVSDEPIHPGGAFEATAAVTPTRAVEIDGLEVALRCREHYQEPGGEGGPDTTTTVVFEEQLSPRAPNLGRAAPGEERSWTFDVDIPHRADPSFSLGPRINPNWGVVWTLEADISLAGKPDLQLSKPLAATLSP
jgi:hypothetical protein